MKFLGNLYTLIEIGINNNFEKKSLQVLSYYMNKKDVEKITENFPTLAKFIPYCNWYVLNNRNILAMSAYVYDLYKDVGFLPDLENYDLEPSKEKLEHWQYINPYIIELNPNEGFEFAKEFYDKCDIWNLFLAGSARMDYYQNEETKIEQRIKYAIVEYMLKRPQFFTTDDFVENEVLLKKYKKE